MAQRRSDERIVVSQRVRHTIDKIEGIITRITAIEVKKKDKLSALCIFERPEIRRKMVEFSDQGYDIPEIREILEQTGLVLKNNRPIAEVLYSELGEEQYNLRHNTRYLKSASTKSKNELKTENDGKMNEEASKEVKQVKEPRDKFDDFYVGG